MTRIDARSEWQLTVEWFRARWVVMVVGFVGAVVVAFAVDYAVSRIDEVLDNRERDRLIAAPHQIFFNYEDVRFVERDGDTLIFESIRTTTRPLHFVWLDELECELSSQPSVWVKVADQPWEGNRLAEPLGPTKWTWFQEFPDDGRRCRMRSFITAETNGVSKSQTVLSDPFVVPPA